MNYFDKQQHKFDRWRVKYPNKPRKVALRMFWWNLKNLFRPLRPRVGAVPEGSVRVAVHLGGGMGDTVLLLPIIDQIQAMGDCVIDIISGEYTSKFTQHLFSMRANVRVLTDKSQEYYDVSFGENHALNLFSFDEASVERKSPKLAVAFRRIREMNASSMPSSPVNGERIATILRRCKFTGENRWTFLEYGGLFDMASQRAGLFIDMYRYGVMDENGLTGVKYVVLSRGADPRGGGDRQTKVWPKESYEELIRMLKGERPEIKVVQVSTGGQVRLAGIDMDVRDADLEDVKVYLKNAAAFFGSEGGMVHLATQLSVPAVVPFGPTPVYYYGYKRNTNIVSSACSDCMFARNDWYYHCPRGLARPECMDSITPRAVADAVFAAADSRRPSRYALEDLRAYSSKGLADYAPVVADIVKRVGMNGTSNNGRIYGPARCYIHSSKRWEYPYILERIAKENGTGLKIADVGGGRGALALYLSKLGHDASVYDMNFNWDDGGDPMTHNRFLRYCADHGVTARVASGFNIPADDGAFDVVVSVSVIEHVKHKEYMLAEMLRVLKPSGLLALTYDLIRSDEQNEIGEAMRVEIMSPKMMREMLAGLGINEDVYAESDVDASRADMIGDRVDIPHDITVGGCAIRKLA
jgi:SAM-dependent methyltransferase